MKFKAIVHHAIKPMFHYNEEATQKLEIISNFYKGEYPIVAELELEADNINHALDITYEKTNHISYQWQENKEVVKIYDAQNGKRSTSVGDVITIGITKYVVAAFGFDKL